MSSIPYSNGKIEGFTQATRKRVKIRSVREEKEKSTAKLLNVKLRKPAKNGIKVKKPSDQVKLKESRHYEP